MAMTENLDISQMQGKSSLLKRLAKYTTNTSIVGAGLSKSTEAHIKASCAPDQEIEGLALILKNFSFTLVKYSLTVF